MNANNKNLTDALRAAVGQLRAEAGPVLSSMVASFRQHQAAMESRRVQHARTGALNPARLAGFKFTDDIFLRRAFVTKGQNHGLVIHLDWSGSMSQSMGNVLWQTLNLVWFAETIKVPVEVYAFSTCHGDPNGSMVCLYDSAHPRKIDAQVMLLGSIFRFVALPAVVADWSDPNTKLVRTGDYYGPQGTETVVDMLIKRLTAKDLRMLSYNPVSNLGATPLHHGFIASIKHVRAFREKHKVDRCVSVWLTDGEDTGGVRIAPTKTFNPYSNSIIMHGLGETIIAPLTGKTYVAAGKAAISTPAQIHKDATGADMVLIHMDSTLNPARRYFNTGSDMAKAMDEKSDAFKKDGVAAFTSRELGGSPFQAVIMTSRTVWSGRSVKASSFKGVTKNQAARDVLTQTTGRTSMRKFAALLVPFIAKGDN